ncbi:MAG: DUF4214 domain-containing protein [Actinobacteria bacterium]|nr:DUF4214 domain-containing protein [Actinomycetota bacterium]
MDIWSTLVTSSVPIRVDARWTALGPGQLGGAGAGDMIRDWTGAPRPSTWYAQALANAIAGTDLSAQPDIVAAFSNDSTLWYLGTDGATPSGKYDLTSVVLHELAHGLGFAGSAEVTSGSGRLGYGSGFPTAFDRFTGTGASTRLTAITGTALGAALTSGNVWFDGVQERAGLGGNRAPLYAPSSWMQGTSYSHWDEAAFPPGNPNSLMTPYIADGESIFDPGDAMLGALRDLGWATAGPMSVAGAPAAPVATSRPAGVDLAWRVPADTGRQTVTGYRIRRYVGSAATPEATVDTGPATSLRVGGLVNGRIYRFTVAAVNASGVGAESVRSPNVAPFDPAPFATADALVTRQYLDFVGRSPTAAEVSLWRTFLSSGAGTPGDAVAGIARSAGSADKVQPVVRLYWAYFLRIPDTGGLRYWVGRYRSGTTLTKISSSFAGSAEFRTRYGSLTNGQFVTRVYQNVFGRNPDPGGLAYWVGKLDAGLSRGTMMVGFSESAEYRSMLASEADTVMLWLGMLGRTPAQSELDATVARLDAGTTLGRIATEVMATTEYAARVA